MSSAAPCETRRQRMGMVGNGLLSRGGVVCTPWGVIARLGSVAQVRGTAAGALLYCSSSSRRTLNTLPVALVLGPSLRAGGGSVV